MAAVPGFNHPPDVAFPTLSPMPKRQRTGVLGCFGSTCGGGGIDPSKPAVVREKLDSKLDDIDMRLASEINALTLEEREKVYHDVHGVSQIIEETPEFVENSLRDMEFALSGIHTKPAFERAFRASPAFVQDRSLRLMFLRAKVFDVNEAARQMVAFFECKLVLFGPACLAREVTFDDLDTDDKECLMAGGMQILRTRDQAGRSLAVLYRKWMIYKDWKNFARSQFYLTMNTTLRNDDEAQKRGHVTVLNMDLGKHQFGGKDFEVFTKGIEIAESLPVRIVSVHCCTAGSALLIFFRAAEMASSRSSRVRFRVHNGSPMEHLYALASFGIPREIHPINDNGDIDLIDHLRIISESREKELGVDAPDLYGSVSDCVASVGLSARFGGPMSQTTSCNIDDKISPMSTDVLMGSRERQIEGNDGNMRLKELVMAGNNRYNASTRFEKSIITSALVSAIHNEGGRFLRRKGGAWRVVSEAEAKGRCSHDFRNYNRSLAIAKR